MQGLRFNFVMKVLLFTVSVNMVFSEDNRNSSAFDYKHFTSIACVFTGMCFETNSNDFFTEYQQYFNPNVSHFSVTPVLGLAFKFKLKEEYRLGLTIEYVQATLNDFLKQSFTMFGNGYERSLSENLKITNYPVMIIVEYMPIENQFEGYVGAGAGFIYSNFEWDEGVSSSYEYDLRKSSKVMNEQRLYPAMRLYTGIELGFDKKPGSNFLGSLIIEAGYTFIFRYINVFSKLSEQFEKVPENWGKKYAIFPGYIGLSIGLSFNFQRREH